MTNDDERVEVEIRGPAWMAELHREIGDAGINAILRLQLKSGFGQQSTPPLNDLDAERYRDAIEWALGANGDFPDREPGDGAYWWRSELQRRAGLEWDGKKFVSVADALFKGER